MSISLLAALAGTVAALAGLVRLILLCARTARMDMIAWVVAMIGLTIGLGVQAAGYRRGFGPTTFRAAQLGAALIAPLALAWGAAELAARGVAARFAARLCLAGLFLVASVILATDVLSSRPFSQAWPTARTHFEFLPLGLLALTAVVTLIIAAVALVVVGVRTRQDPRWQAALLPVVAAGVGVLAVQGLQASLPANAAYAALTAAVAALTWLAGERASRVPVPALRGAGSAHGAGRRGAAHGRAGYAADDDSLGLYGDGYRRYDDTGGFTGYRGGYGDTGGFGASDFQPGDPGGYGPGGYPGTGDFSSYPAAGPGGHYNDVAPEPVTGAFDPAAEPMTGAFDSLYRDNGPPGRGSAPPASPAAATAAAGPGSGVEPVTGMQLAALEEAVLGQALQEGAAGEGAGAGGAAGDAAAAGAVDTERLYGQIAIYTLLEAGAAEFDRLASQVLEQVRSGEPDTLVYVVHAVPSAPLQRILYQVYRDRAAYDEHLRQPYVADFDARLRPLVLATNVIELGVRQAKMSALGRPPGREP
jgi:quinol monooxygenase YgiN